MAAIRIYALIIKIAVSLALLGQLKFCTLQLLGLASENSAFPEIPKPKATEPTPS